jgi:hypothetical protein
MATISVRNEVVYLGNGLTDIGDLTPVPGGGWQFASYATAPAPVRTRHQDAWNDATDYAEEFRSA